MSELYINQCDINNNFYNDVYYSNFRNNKLLFNQNLYINDFKQQINSLHEEKQRQQQQQPAGQQQNPLELTNEIEVFHSSHKCHRQSMLCDFRPQYTNPLKISINGWTRGSYQCVCKPGYYSIKHPDGFNGTIMEMAYYELQDNISTHYVDSFYCLPCAPGCAFCLDNSPCLASYNWPFR